MQMWFSKNTATNRSVLMAINNNLIEMPSVDIGVTEGYFIDFSHTISAQTAL